MSFCVYLLGNIDCSNQSNTTRQSDIEESANQPEKSQEDTEIMDLQGAVKELSTSATVHHEPHKPL